MSRVYDLFPHLAGREPDTRARRYLTPVSVVWTQGEVRDPEVLTDPTKKLQTYFPTNSGSFLKNKPGGEKAAVLVDFGVEFNGSARLVIGQLEGLERANIRVRFGESVMEAMSDIGEKNATNDHANRDFTWNIGFLSGNESNESGFRFCRIDLLDDADVTVQILSLDGVFIFRDLEYKGSFECDDEEVNKIWRTAAYTVHLNMQEYLWDGIKRDRLVWLGDLHTEILTVCSVFGYDEVVPKSLDFVRDITPLPGWMNGSTSYSLWWVLIQYDWYMHHGNFNYLNEQKEYMTGLLDLLSGMVAANGSEKLPGHRFMDWPNHDRPDAIHAGLHSMLVMSLEKGAYMLDLLGEPDVAAKCAASAKKLRAYIPSPANCKQAAALMAMAELDCAKKLNAEVLSPGGAKGFSTFFGYYLLRAKALAGDHSGALEAMKAYWGGMLRMGATTFWEDFDIDWMENAVGIDRIVPPGKVDIHGDWGNFCYVKLRHSLCHGWSSGPVPYLTENVLGVSVAEPACGKLVVNPNLDGLNYVSGSFPTPRGTVNIKHAKQNSGKIETQISAPDGVKIEVAE